MQTEEFLGKFDLVQVTQEEIEYLNISTTIH